MTKELLTGEVRSRLIDDDVLQRLSYYPRAQAAVRHACGRLPEAICLADIASAAGMNPSAFSRYFADKVGMSLFAFLRTLRVELALRELERRDLSLSFLADCAGYRNAATFSRAFKAVVGQTPSEYRRRFRPSSN
jgi:AraC-like DNA-binding protein